MPSEFVTDLVDHKSRVASYMQLVATELFNRASVHDNSKFSSEEFEAYETAFPELQKYAYGSEEFKGALRTIQPALEHHYQANRHHPEHHPNGIVDMNLIDLIEMVCDWLAASSRSNTSMMQGLVINKKKFSIDNQLSNILTNTITDLREKEIWS